MAYIARKGSILVAMLFAIVLSLTIVSFLVMIGGRTKLTANQLKRAQAINCAEAAIYEAFNRFRAGTWDRTANVNQSINIPTAVDPNVQVVISYTAATGEISATVNYDDITM